MHSNPFIAGGWHNSDSSSIVEFEIVVNRLRFTIGSDRDVDKNLSLSVYHG